MRASSTGVTTPSTLASHMRPSLPGHYPWRECVSWSLLTTSSSAPTTTGTTHVVFAFPYRADIVDAVRAIPGRRFDWEAKEWWAPQADATAPYVQGRDRAPPVAAGGADDVAPG